MPAAVQDGAVDADVCRFGRREDLLRSGDAVFHHPRGVLSDPVVDPRRWDAMTVFQNRVERDAVVLLRQVLADRRQAKAITIEATEGGVMTGAPRQQALCLAGDGLGDRPDAA